ncbi:MAG: signal peptidase I [Jatrophihabitantaceae bacterium]
MSIGRRITIAVVSLAILGLVGTGVSFWLRGYRVYVIHTGSMSPTYRPGDIVVDGPHPQAVRPGQVITFRHSALTTDVVTHRVTQVTPEGINTKGDANRTPDAWTIRPNQVKGRVLFGVRNLGYLLVYLKQPAGIGSIATAVFGLLLLWRMFFPSESEDESAAHDEVTEQPSPHTELREPVPV